MPAYDFHSPRLYVDQPLAEQAPIPLAPEQLHYLRDVLRLSAGDNVLVFNGREGEWRATLALAKKTGTLTAAEQVRPQTRAGDLHYCFAPLKHARLDYMVQKAVEMGASHLLPVLTQRTQVTRVNSERMRANAIEAAEQCGILTVPVIADPISLGALPAALGAERLLIFCDEAAEIADPVAALAAHVPKGRCQPLAVLIGPEGGFTEEERATLLRLPRVVRLALGPRILRADTAAVAALSIVQATLGDWR
jgi:16S rRNA (uracil1498-N3)-methyltransferase